MGSSPHLIVLVTRDALGVVWLTGLSPGENVTNGRESVGNREGRKEGRKKKGKNEQSNHDDGHRQSEHWDEEEIKEGNELVEPIQSVHRGDIGHHKEDQRVRKQRKNHEVENVQTLEEEEVMFLGFVKRVFSGISSPC